MLEIFYDGHIVSDWTSHFVLHERNIHDMSSKLNKFHKKKFKLFGLIYNKF